MNPAKQDRSVSSRQTEYTHEHSSVEELAGGYGHMLTEDVRLQVMPIGGRCHTREVTVSVSSGDGEWLDLILQALSRGTSRRSEALEVLGDFISRASASLVALGSVYFEIVYSTEAESSRPSSFTVVPIQTGTIRKSRRGLSQHVVTESGTTKSIPLDPATMLQLQLPPRIRSSYPDLQLAFAEIGSEPLPEIAMKQLRGQADRARFDFDAHERMRAELLARSTAALGWDARGLLGEYCVEHYSIRRRLRFHEFLIDLREVILDQLNVGIAAAAKRMGRQGMLKIDGLPSIEDVALAVAELDEGNTSFAKLLDRLRF